MIDKYVERFIPMELKRTEGAMGVKAKSQLLDNLLRKRKRRRERRVERKNRRRGSGGRGGRGR